jgi:hydrogenase maturation protease
MASNVLILGIGNPLWAEESFGIRCVERLARGWRFDENVQILDGGTQGLHLLPFLEETDILVVFDALDCGLPPGTLRIVEGAAVPALPVTQGQSPHRTGFREAIATARRMGCCPDRLLLVGCQPGARPGDDIDAAIALALGRLGDWGTVPRQMRNEGRLPAGWPIRRVASEAARASLWGSLRTGGVRFLSWGA